MSPILPVSDNWVSSDDYPTGVRTGVLGTGPAPSPLGACVCLPMKWAESSHLGRIIEKVSSDKQEERLPDRVAHRTQSHLCDGRWPEPGAGFSVSASVVYQRAILVWWICKSLRLAWR